jgi:hypothetical protein
MDPTPSQIRTQTSSKGSLPRPREMVQVLASPQAVETPIFSLSFLSRGLWHRRIFPRDYPCHGWLYRHHLRRSLRGGGLRCCVSAG